MPLTPGTKLGQYEVSSPLGAGGMGEVYRARDTRLKRDVAVKVLPTEFSRDSERVARFQREAEVLAALNHPNIASIYELYEERGSRFLVLELVDGETLAARIQSGPIPMEEALHIATQICEALAAAHEKGIVHRDLKPANVQITSDGRVKVLDFGLAKAVESGSGGIPAESSSHSPTLPTPTVAGIILGTASYMSPEQARGKRLDKRSDIWSFGCVLYEMLTRQPAFGGEMVTEVLAGILKGEPDWQRIESFPSGVQSVTRRCLEKDLRKRFHDIGDVRVEIENALSTPMETAIPQRNRSVWTVAAPLALGALILGAALAWRFKPEASSTGTGLVTRSTISLQPADQLGRNYMGTAGTVLTSVRPSRTSFALSPDGRNLVFSGTRGDATQLYLRPFDKAAATPIAGTENGLTPFFSPDGQWIGFWADSKLKKVPLAGGPAVVICDAPGDTTYGGIYGASWGDGGTIVFRSSDVSDVSVVSSAGGTPRTMQPDPSQWRYRLPQVLPGGKFALFTVVGIPTSNKPGIAVRGIEGGESRILIEDGSDGRFVATGHLIFMRAGTLMAAPFDPEKRQVTGAPVAILDGVMHAESAPNGNLNSLAGQFSVSSSGTLVYVSGGIHHQLLTSLHYVDRDGKMGKPGPEPTSDHLSGLRLSPDGTKLASFGSILREIWVLDIARQVPMQLTFKGLNGHPVWSPDGRSLAFDSAESDSPNLFLIAADGSGPPERLTTSPKSQSAASWSRAGNVLAFLETGNVWVLPMTGERKPKLFLAAKTGEITYPEFSRDGQWMAYASTESGRNEVYVSPYPGPGGQHPISAGGGQEPVWSPNGRQLFYRNGRQMLALDVTTGATFTASTPRLLFEGDFASSSPLRRYDITPDGKYFVMARDSLPPEEKPVTQLNVVLNWFEELKRQAPAGKAPSGTTRYPQP